MQVEQFGLRRLDPLGRSTVFMRHDIDRAGQKAPFFAQAQAAFADPWQRVESILHLFDQRVELFILYRARHLIAEVPDCRAGVFETVVQHVQGDHDGRDRIGPPPAHPDPKDAHDPGKPCHPICLVHHGIGIERLVMEHLGGLHFQVAENDRHHDAIGQRRDHHPAEPNGGAEKLDTADGGVLLFDERDGRVDDKKNPDPAERHGADQISD